MQKQYFERIQPTLTSQSSDPSVDLCAMPHSRTSKVRRREKLLPHQKVSRVIRLMAWISILFIVAVSTAMIAPAAMNPSKNDNSLFYFVAIADVIALLLTRFLFFVAKAVMRHAAWGRYVGIAYGIFLLFGFPLGTFVGCYILWNLIFRWTKYDVQNLRSSDSQHCTSY